MFCPNCGQQNDDAAENCQTCGQPLNRQDEQVPPPVAPEPPSDAYPPAAPVPPAAAPDPYAPGQGYSTYPPAPPAPPYGQGGGGYYPPQNRPPMPPTYLWQSILVLILCCWPLGIPAVVFATQVTSKYNAGDFAGAQQASARAKMWTIIALVAGIIGGIVYFGLVVTGTMMSELGGY